MIRKTKFYIARIVPDQERCIEVYTDLGAFTRERDAYNRMMEPDTSPEGRQVNLWVRKAEFKGCYTVSGKQALRHPELYHETPWEKRADRPERQERPHA
jgi:hypothetical protein